MTVRPLGPSDEFRPAGALPRRLAKAVRVGVRADDPVTDAGLRRWVRSSGSELALVRDIAQADVVLLAVDRRPQSWIRATADELRAETAGCAVVIIVDVPLGADAPLGSDLGADAMMTRDELTRETLVGAGLRAVGQWVPPATAPVASPDAADEPDEARPSVLTDRERAVLRLLADGMDLAETARTLSYSERTVKNILYTMLGRLRLKNRVHAVSFAIRHELI